MSINGINTDPLQRTFYVRLRIFAHKKPAITGRLSQRYEALHL